MLSVNSQQSTVNSQQSPDGATGIDITIPEAENSTPSVDKETNLGGDIRSTKQWL